MADNNRFRFWSQHHGPLFPLDIRSIGYGTEPLPGITRRGTEADFFIIMWTDSGSYRIEMKGEQHEPGPQSLFIIPPRTPHTYGPTQKDRWIKYWFTLYGASAAALMKNLALNRPTIRTDQKVPRFLFDQLLNTAMVPGIKGASERTAAALKILYHISAFDQQQKAPETFSRIMAWAHDHIDQNLNVDSMARESNMSRSHFSREFKKETGVTPKQFVLNCKMGRAQELLMTTRLPAKEIAFQSGWCDDAHFNKQFVKRYGCTPLTFRKTSAV